jgi:hypothetical protein
MRLTSFLLYLLPAGPVRTNAAKGIQKFRNMKSWQDYQQKNKDRFLSELLELLRIPSVSARSEHKPDMQKCAEAVKQRLLDAGPSPEGLVE